MPEWVKAKASFSNGNCAEIAEVDLAWVKAEKSNPNGACAQIAALPDGGVVMRNSRFPDSEMLAFTRAEFAAFLDGAKNGEFDRFAQG